MDSADFGQNPRSTLCSVSVILGKFYAITHVFILFSQGNRTNIVNIYPKGNLVDCLTGCRLSVYWRGESNCSVHDPGDLEDTGLQSTLEDQ